ncbi:Phosphodiesterase transmembrane protein [Lysobacter dokdonensis DS-58]|uniref:Phosphodiesterase transmembrane protein n=1 Tax=Lysobacter dokdonensis DS-58 TaxID=1300345 RepID=A0A0A2WNJ8_9GAMM|nr:EAL domain-containing protein [Lysobacter dokdonensis]KGQ20312.1 Phosphodiesterase transmembrane protein [Lysobacter dokdonensis DS-58]
MNFRIRLASFFVAALVVMQGLTAFLVYRVTRSELIGEGQRQLDVAARAFAGQLDELSNRVSASVQVLAFDFALRSAIAQRDHATVVSALRNHGMRVGAKRMLLVGVDGRVEADTDGKFAPGAAFPFTDLTTRALEAPASAITAWEGRAYWVVVVPVSAPDLVGFIAAAIPVDDRLLERLQRQSALPKRIELATRGRDGQWHIVAQGGGDADVDVTPALAALSPSLATRPAVIEVEGREYVAQAVPLSHSQQSAPVAAVLGYSVDAALQPYRSVGAAWAVLLGLGLLVGLMVAFFIARSVSRPVEALADAARRIADGDDSVVPPSHDRGDELGQLSGAFSHMVQALREREARIRHQAGHDLVTGLPNRMAAEAAIGRALEASPSARAALLMIGLARLPEIINTMGHVVSDRLMADAAARIAPLAGDGLVARATDDEFSVFLPAATRSEAVSIALRFVEALSEPYRESEFTLDLQPAIGIALSPKHGGEASTLLRRAEVALLGAMGTEEPVALYDPTTDPHRPERLSLMSDLRKVLEGPGVHGELSLMYQPKLHLPTGRIDGAEGLLRWRHPVAGPLAPDAFIALAEETGNIRRLTRWVLGAGIEQAGRWQAAGDDLRLSLNVSARDLDDVDLPRRVAGLLAAHGVSPSRIVLEITESAIMGKPETAITVLRRLAEQGIELAIDDFGVGQSSFAYLRRLPVRELKIDRTFIANLAHSREDRAIVRSIADLGHDLGYRVTAEGVEDAYAVELLRDMGCDYAQGYQVGRPLTADAFLSLVSSTAGVEA